MVKTYVSELDLSLLRKRELAAKARAFRRLRAARPASLEESRQAVFRYCDSFAKLGHIMYLRSCMADGDWLSLLGEFWSDCDNIWEYQELLRRELANRCPAPEMMTTRERAAFGKLPTVISIYRGASATNINGASWSLDRKVAMRFHTFNRYGAHSEPLLVSANVRRVKVVALKLDRKEREIITFDAEVLKVEPI